MVGALEGACGRKAYLEIRKPNSIMLEIMSERFKFSFKDCVVIGDGLDSDIIMANRVNIPSILIKDNHEFDNINQPTYSMYGKFNDLVNVLLILLYRGT